MFKRMQSMQMQAVHCFQITSPEQHEYRAIIALHNTHLGPALGGCRCLPYKHEQLAFDDVMRLAQGMSYKAALANIPQGGGKAVILLPKNIPEEQLDRHFLFSWFGHCVEQLNGQYITAMDVGTQVSDMDVVAQQTRHVASASNIGDPADATAEGVIEGIKASLDFDLNIHSARSVNPFVGKSFAIQGLGHVGWRVAKAIQHWGGHIIAADTDEKKCRQAQALGMKIVSSDNLLVQPCDVLVPCALGGIIHADNVNELRCRIIAGSANNQLADNSIAEILDQKNILYAPDYVINAGGLIFASMQYKAQYQLFANGSEKINAAIDKQITEQINAKILGIYSTLMSIFQQASYSHKNINLVANEIAQQRLSSEINLDPLGKGDVYDAA